MHLHPRKLTLCAALLATPAAALWEEVRLACQEVTSLVMQGTTLIAGTATNGVRSRTRIAAAVLWS